MIPTSAKEKKIQDLVRRVRDKTRHFRGRDLSDNNEHRIGLLPKEGWRQRNAEFLQNIVIPSIFSPREGQALTPDFAGADPAKAMLTWVGHASFLLQVCGKNILIDPNWALWHSFFKRVRFPGVALRDLPPIDIVLISHAHFDHMHLPSLTVVARGQPILVPRGVGKIVKRMNFRPVVEMDWWDDYTFENLNITFTPARHWGARYVHDAHRGFGGFAIRSELGSIYHCGDSSYFSGFKEIGERCEVDIALMPIGAYRAPSGREVHMNPEEAIEAFQELGAREMVPMHYGTFPLGGEPMSEPLERLVIRSTELELTDRIHVLDEGCPKTFLGSTIITP